MALTPTEAANLASIRALYTAIANGPDLDAFERISDPSLVQEEYPNRLLPQGARRDLAGLRDAMAKGKALMAAQTFELVSATAMDDRVLVEGRWTGTVGADIGPFKAGMVLRTHFAQAFQMHEGRIVAIRNYDCFDPW